MIEYKQGDILQDDAEALVNTVNCVGVMGRGVALQFKNTFPENFKTYAAACKKEEVRPGRMFVFETSTLTNPKYIINFPTKRHWRGLSKMEDIISGLQALIEVIEKKQIKSIAIPPLGSGLGGLDWKQVKNEIEQALLPLQHVNIRIYTPLEGSQTITSHTQKPPKMTTGRAALVGLINHYLAGMLDPFVTLLEIHKLMYFMQESGEPLRLNYVKGPYGPYAENLRHVLNAVEGYLLSGYKDGGDLPNKRITLIPGAVEDSIKFLQSYPETKTRFEEVSKLVEGFESPFGLELLSTVYWIMKNETNQTEKGIIQSMYAWNEHKKQFSERQIILAVHQIKTNGWLENHKQ